MIHHISIPARDPERVAKVLAELIGGRAFRFSGPLAGAAMAVSGDAHGTMFEVYPDLARMRPGEGEEGQVEYCTAEAPEGLFPFHALVSTPLTRSEVEALGAREGWRTRFFGRAAPGQPPVFHVLELWVENRLMLEIATADMAQTYAGFMQPDRMEAMGLAL